MSSGNMQSVVQHVSNELALVIGLAISRVLPLQWSRNEFHVGGGAIFVFLVVYNCSAKNACRRCFLLPSTKTAIQV